MGYYTDYCLTCYTMERDKNGSVVTSNNVPDILMREVEKEIEKMNVFTVTDDPFCVNTTWYDWEHDMRVLSSKFPELMFELTGAGENYEDLWTSYFNNGKMQYCPATITYDDFDISKLRDDPNDKQPNLYSYQC